VLGVALPAAAYALGTSAAGLVAALAIAALVIGSGLAGTAPSGRGTIPVRAQAAYDEGLTFGLLATAVVFGVASDPGAGALFGLAGAMVLLICLTTRYSPGARRSA
jgi:hypothetical protein